MASNSAPLQEWLVIVPDHEGALQKRIAVRQEHLGGLKKDDDSFWLWGGMCAFLLLAHALSLVSKKRRESNDADTLNRFYA